MKFLLFSSAPTLIKGSLATLSYYNHVIYTLLHTVHIEIYVFLKSILLFSIEVIRLKNQVRDVCSSAASQQDKNASKD